MTTIFMRGQQPEHLLPARNAHEVEMTVEKEQSLLWGLEIVKAKSFAHHTLWSCY